MYGFPFNVILWYLRLHFLTSHRGYNTPLWLVTSICHSCSINEGCRREALLYRMNYRSTFYSCYVTYHLRRRLYPENFPFPPSSCHYSKPFLTVYMHLCKQIRVSIVYLISETNLVVPVTHWPTLPSPPFSWNPFSVFLQSVCLFCFCWTHVLEWQLQTCVWSAQE